jgi:hypothetical protein
MTKMWITLTVLCAALAAQAGQIVRCLGWCTADSGFVPCSVGEPGCAVE